ncbi:MAG: dipeptidase PepE [Acidobacteriota bacterium]|jgi:dipeptidase E|nr:dipeptidase PepE [Acidobacteriota bacterium]
MDLSSRKLFLSSNSVYKNMSYLEHSAEDMVDFLGRISRITFIPFASVAENDLLDKKWNEYNEAPKKAFEKYNIEVESLHTFSDKSEAVKEAEAIFIGGGNTHHLLYWLRKFELIEVIRSEMTAGKPLMGSSAGTNIFCPTICTTNDMPIISNPNFDAINAIPFQINPHYLDPDPNSDHRGETRQQRIEEFLKVNNRKVLGLREGAWLRIENGRILLKGLSGARLFSKSNEPEEFSPTKEGFDLTDILLE